MFLPINYPASVHHCYVRFHCWQALETYVGAVVLMSIFTFLYKNLKVFIFLLAACADTFLSVCCLTLFFAYMRIRGCLVPLFFVIVVFYLVNFRLGWRTLQSSHVGKLGSFSRSSCCRCRRYSGRFLLISVFFNRLVGSERWNSRSWKAYVYQKICSIVWSVLFFHFFRRAL
jgi:hypothetical protein